MHSLSHILMTTTTAIVVQFEMKMLALPDDEVPLLAMNVDKVERRRRTGKQSEAKPPLKKRKTKADGHSLATIEEKEGKRKSEEKEGESVGDEKEEQADGEEEAGKAEAEVIDVDQGASLEKPAIADYDDRTDKEGKSDEKEDDSDEEGEDTSDEPKDSKVRTGGGRGKPKAKGKAKAKNRAKAKKKSDGESYRDQSKSKKFSELFDDLPGEIQECWRKGDRALKTEMVNKGVERSGGKLSIKNEVLWGLVASREELQKGKEKMKGYCWEEPTRDTPTTTTLTL